MKKTIFTIPGFGDKVSEPQYKWMKSFFERHVFRVRPVPILWNYRVMSDYVDEFEKYYRKHKTAKNYVLGFSFGAMIAFISAQKILPDKLYLCSLSPYFKEDLHTLKPYWERLIGSHRLQDFQKFTAKKIGKALTVTTTIFYGEREAKKYPQIKVRCRETARYIKNANLVVVEDAPHRIDHPNYIQAIKMRFVQNKL